MNVIPFSRLRKPPTDFKPVTTRGIYLRLPFTKLSLWVEWRECSVGYGWQKNDTADLEFFAGRLQGVFSFERN